MMKFRSLLSGVLLAVCASAFARDPIVVGISETCPGDGSVRVPGAYAEAVRRSGDVPVIISRTAQPADLDLIVSRLDLLLLPGGEDVEPRRYGERSEPVLGKVNVVRDQFETDLLRAAVRRKLPIVGICRGAQHLNVFFGGTLYQDLPSALGANYTVEHRSPADYATRRRDHLHAIEILPGSRLASACGTTSATVNSRHHQAVKRLAPGFRVTARAADGVVEAIESDLYPAAGVQFHPENLENDPVWTRFYTHLADFAGAIGLTSSNLLMRGSAESKCAIFPLPD